MKPYLITIFTVVLLLCTACTTTLNYPTSNYREGWVVAKYSVNDDYYIVELEDYYHKNRRYTVQTNYKTWKLLQLGQYTTLKKRGSIEILYQ